MLHARHLPLSLLMLALAACGGGDDTPPVPVTPPLTPPVTPAPPATYYQTKTPYTPQQDAATYEAAPAGYAPVFTELVARHGSRGLSSMKYDAAFYNVWQRAAADDALTPLGQKLGADILKLMKANALLGYGVDGITAPGYGNLSQTGINEHKQLAVRMLTRLPALFAQLGANATSAPRQIVTISSGVDRAKDSAAYFAQSLAATAPNVAPLITLPPAPAGYPAGKPVVQPNGTNRFLLYAHKLVPKTDLVTDALDRHYQTYQDSQAYQAYLESPGFLAKYTAIDTDATARTLGREVLERLFTKTFVDKIDNGTYRFANTGTYSFTSDDGKFTNTVTGDGGTTIKGLADAASVLYNLYAIMAGMTNEVKADFVQYMPSDAAKYQAFVQDYQDFYNKGPGTTESAGVTWNYVRALRDDFFTEVDAIARGDLSHGAKLRFTHAEAIIPLATAMGLKTVVGALPAAQTYSYDNSSWRGLYVAPMAANMQWDVYRDAGGNVLVKMLYNEKETDFQAACDGARFAAGSHFYVYAKLKTCYGHMAQ